MDSLGSPVPTEQAADLPAPAPQAATAAAPLCGSCRKPGATAKCGVCKKAVYCDATCQRKDWQFHKRTCKAPEVKKKDEAPAPKKEEAPKPATPKPATSSVPAGEDELDEDEKAALKEISKGYRYFARKLDEKETAMIGDIAPKAISASASDSLAANNSAPTPLSADAAKLSAASAWNQAGTVEERNLTSWARNRFKELLKAARASGELSAPVPGVGTVRVSGIQGFGQHSTASIILARGKTKRVYDFSFKVTVEVQSEGVTEAELVDEEEPKEDKDSKPKDGDDKAKKAPRVYLRFPEVSNTTEGEPARVLVEWAKSPAVHEGQRDVVSSVLAVDNHSAGMTSAIRRVVDTLVAEFMAL